MFVNKEMVACGYVKCLPGSGKTRLCKLLKAEGYNVVDGDDIMFDENGHRLDDIEVFYRACAEGYHILVWSIAPERFGCFFETDIVYTMTERSWIDGIMSYRPDLMIDVGFDQLNAWLVSHFEWLGSSRRAGRIIYSGDVDVSRHLPTIASCKVLHDRVAQIKSRAT